MAGDRGPQQSGARPPTTPGFDAARLIETNQRAMRAALEAQNQGMQHMAKIGTSVLEFVQRRLRHDAEFAQRLGTVKAPEDAYEAYHDFFDIAVREYSDEFSALSTLCADQTKEALHDAEHRANGAARPAVPTE